MYPHGHARRDASASPCGDDSEQLHTLVNGVTGVVEGKVSLAALPSLDTLLELDEMYMDEFHQALLADESSEVVILRPECELYSSSFIDEAVLGEIKAALNNRSGSSILKNSSDLYYPLVNKFQDVVCHNPLSVLPPDIEMYVIKLTWFLEPDTALHGSGSCQKSNVTSFTKSFVQSTRRIWCVRVNRLTLYLLLV